MFSMSENFGSSEMAETISVILATLGCGICCCILIQSIRNLIESSKQRKRPTHTFLLKNHDVLEPEDILKYEVEPEDAWGDEVVWEESIKTGKYAYKPQKGSALVFRSRLISELVLILCNGKTYEFRQIFNLVFTNLNEKYTHVGHEEFVRLRCYENLQLLVNRGLVHKSQKTYRGLDGLKVIERQLKSEEQGSDIILDPTPKNKKNS